MQVVNPSSDDSDSPLEVWDDSDSDGIIDDLDNLFSAIPPYSDGKVGKKNRDDQDDIYILDVTPPGGDDKVGPQILDDRDDILDVTPPGGDGKFDKKIRDDILDVIPPPTEDYWFRRIRDNNNALIGVLPPKGDGKIGGIKRDERDDLINVLTPKGDNWFKSADNRQWFRGKKSADNRGWFRGQKRDIPPRPGNWFRDTGRYPPDDMLIADDMNVVDGKLKTLFDQFDKLDELADGDNPDGFVDGSMFR